MGFEYFSSQMHSHYMNGKGQTRRNTVSIKNGKGTKCIEVLDKRGKTIKKSKGTLKKSEIEKIKQNRFIPGLMRKMKRVL